ncbi:MAG: lysophospholipid acyltransferase family protein [Micromonosporaceae bacterium]
MSGEVIRLNDKRGAPGAGPTARIAPRSTRKRHPRQPVIPRPEQLGAGPAQTPHLKAVEPGTIPAVAVTEPDEWDRRIASLLAFLRRRVTGDYTVDEFGFDADLTGNVMVPLLRLLYRHWFRVEVTGVENLPADGSALLVANHSGTVALDALMLTVAVHDEHPSGRHLRQLGADFVFSTPLLAEMARKSGATLACNPDAERLLNSGELVAVFPEGFKGVGKPFSERYKLQRFGRGGFVSAALRTKAPIIPVSIVGAEETYPLIGDITPLARLLEIPYFPVTPLFPWLGPLGMIPLPSKWLIEFGEPIHTGDLAASADDPMAVFNLADQVRETIQQTLYQVLLRRDGIFG